MLRPIAFALACLIAAAASAQTPVAIVRGTIAAVAADSLTMKARAGGATAVRLSQRTRVIDVTAASPSDLKPNAFIGVAAVPDKDGGLKALEVHIFPEAMRGTGEGFRPFDLAPQSTMTNGALTLRIEGVEGDKLTVTYKGGSQTIRLPHDAPIVAFTPGDMADLKPGAAAIARGTIIADGRLDAAAVIVGKNGLVPPM